MKQKKFTFKASKELLDFADDISKRFKELKIADYYSEKEKYHVQILPVISNPYTFGDYNTVSRFGHTSNTIQINRKYMLPYCRNFIFWQILWNACGIELLKHKIASIPNNELHDANDFKLLSEDYYVIDKLATREYKKTKRPIKNVAVDFIKSVSKSSPSNFELNRKRIEFLMKLK